MNAILELSEARVKVHIERQTKIITAMQADLDKELPSFKDIEQEYFQWKKKIDEKLLEISIEKDELNQLIHFDKYKHQPKPHLIQQQIVTKKKKFKNTDIVPLPQIKWRDIIEPQIKAFGRFVTYKELWKRIIELKLVEDTFIVNRRFYTVTAGKNDIWFHHNRMLGLKIWADDNLIPKPEFLNDFYKSAV